MSFSMQISGHAGAGVQPTDEDEGQRVKAFIADVLDSAASNGLNVTISNMSPERWGGEKMIVYDASADGSVQGSSSG
jgi:hypothetical protein